MNITVFGTARIQPEDQLYKDAYFLGRLLAEAGHTVLTGGYVGSMEAVSRGAAEAGGHVVGITCEDIERWRQVKCNQWVIEERRFPTLRERLNALIDSSDAALALPGGAGTLAEISMMWNQLHTASIHPRPLVLIGPAWKKVFDTFFESMPSEFIPLRDRLHLNFVPDVKTAVQSLNEKLLNKNNQGQ